MLIESPSVGRLLEEVAGPYPMCAWNRGWGYQGRQGDSINMVGLTEYTFIHIYGGIKYQSNMFFLKNRWIDWDIICIPAILAILIFLGLQCSEHDTESTIKFGQYPILPGKVVT